VAQDVRNSASAVRSALASAARPRARQLREAFAMALSTDELELHVRYADATSIRACWWGGALIRWRTAPGLWVPPDELLAAAGGRAVAALDAGHVARHCSQCGWRGAGAPRAGHQHLDPTLHDPAFRRDVAAALHRRGCRGGAEIEIPRTRHPDLPAWRAPFGAAGGGVRSRWMISARGIPSCACGAPAVQRLKLDRSIVANLPDDPKA
jgi:hypothetical protein